MFFPFQLFSANSEALIAKSHFQPNRPERNSYRGSTLKLFSLRCIKYMENIEQEKIYIGETFETLDNNAMLPIIIEKVKKTRKKRETQ